jgi:ABC-2 type transport system permease protein
MNAFFAFFKKEVCELTRTHKLTVLGLVFLLFGIMSPLAAKFMPEILLSALPEGMTITLPEPSAMDSWGQFFKNISQMGMIVLVILFGGIMSNELSRGTLTHLLTKGLSRKTVILSKFTAAGLAWTAAYVLCLVTTFAYTVYFWPDDTVQSLLTALLGLWVFGLLLLSVLLLGGVIFKNNYGSLLFAGAFVAVLNLLNLLRPLQPLNPVLLTSGSMALLSGQRAAMDFTLPLLITAGLTLILLLQSILVFSKRAL